MKENPFIIWTFRRSGGTNLAHKLITSSTFDTVEHEPFNRDRIFSYVTNQWLHNRDIVELEHALREILSRRINFKHCLEIIPQEINELIARLSIEYGYKHLCLYRENSLSRLLSLQYSVDTGNWGEGSGNRATVDISNKLLPIKKLIKHELSARKNLEDIFHYLESNTSQNVYYISFESIFKSDRFEGIYLAKQLFSELCPNFTIDESGSQIENLFTRGKQGTSSEYNKYANYDEFKIKAQEIMTFTPIKKPERPSIVVDGINIRFINAINKGKVHALLDANINNEQESVKGILENNSFHFEYQGNYVSEELEDNINMRTLGKDPLVSVVIPTYNVSSYIKRCLDSVINQSYKNIEILVIDDVGQDDSIDKVKSYDDERIEIITHEKNKGLAGARNTGIERAKGQFILFLDSDDYIDDKLIEKCIYTQFLDDVDVVAFSSQHVDDNGNLFPVEWFEKYSGETHSSSNIKERNSHNIIAWDVAAWSKLIRLDFLKDNDITFQEEQRYFEDHYFSAKLYSMEANFSYIDEKLHYYYRRSDDNNKSITQIVSPLVSYYRSRMMKEVSTMLREREVDYRDVFFPVYYTLYKHVVFEAFDLKEYQRDVYNNVRLAFRGLEGLSTAKEAELWEMDLAFLIQHYSFEEFTAKFKPVWKWSVSDLKECLPNELQCQLQCQLDDYTVQHKPVLSVTPGLMVSAVIFASLSVVKLRLMNWREFKLRVRDFHIIRKLGVVSSTSASKLLTIFDYVTGGEEKGHKINDKFSASKYLENNPSLESMSMGLYSHFLFYGKAQRRNIEGQG
ncbi:glycosyltransferase family 2 protein [Vibrio sp. 1CM23M]|uniref:glycosyltransferase family 2 protein n=1 Tax=Vibrio sp. 1CM23M TaxID=2929164 RepID=UPI0020BFA7EB|nr:glycosyltransferase family 2 protein [Vibrio sp. 1CM23M]MCK8073693.1 glycosyltransferase family 2 protein [Vibrio sp. 1CM23M]